jgi:hypothetical protein
MPLAQLAEADLFLTAQITAEEISYGLGVLGLVLSGIAITLAVMHWRAISKVHSTIERAEQQTTRNLDETRKVGDQTLQALNLHELLAADEALSNSANGLAEDYAQVLRVDDEFLKQRATQDLNQTRTYMNMVAEGHLTIGPEALAADEEIPSALLNIAKPGECFWASSVVSPAFWARASAYLQLQKERIEQNVTVNRVFIFKDQKEFENEHAQEQLRLQAKKGINVHYVVEPEYTAQDLVAVARPNPESQTDPDLVRYAAEFAVTDGRVTGIQVWSSAAGHEDRVDRLWNILRRFYDDSDQYILAESTSP